MNKQNLVEKSIWKTRGMIKPEARYRTMARLAEKSGCTLVDMPCRVEYDTGIMFVL